MADAAPLPPSGPVPVANSVVAVTEIVTQGHCDVDGTLALGELLKWMDITACLAAERHCKTNCVTISMDEVHFPSKGAGPQQANTITVGQAVSLRGQVNNAFNTSMEVGVLVSTESLSTGETSTVWRAPRESNPSRWWCPAIIVDTSAAPACTHSRANLRLLATAFSSAVSPSSSPDRHTDRHPILPAAPSRRPQPRLLHLRRAGRERRQVPRRAGAARDLRGEARVRPRH